MYILSFVLIIKPSPKVLPGCGCCEFEGKLVSDKHTWQDNGKTYGEKILNQNTNKLST